MLIAPASANVIGKIAGGIADDMLTTTVMASTAPVLISPAMNTHMYENPIVQDNLEKLRRFGYKIIAPAVGMLACRDVGAGKMPEPETLLEWILQEIACEKRPQRQKKDSDYSRTHPGIPGSGAVSDQSFHREDGLCAGEVRCTPWGRGHTGDRTDCIAAAAVCGNRSRDNSGGDVPGGHIPCGTAGCRDYGGGCGGLSPHRNRRRKAKEKRTAMR